MNYFNSINNLIPLIAVGTTKQSNKTQPAPSKTPAPKTYKVDIGAGLYTATARLTNNLLLQNDETLDAVLRFNHFNPEETIDIEGKTLKFPQIPQNVKNLSRIGFKIYAHYVQELDTYSQLAEKLTDNYMNADMLSDLNGKKKLKIGDIIYVPYVSNIRSGDRLFIPHVSVHTAKSADTYTKLALDHTGNAANADEISYLNKNESLIIGKKVYTPKFEKNSKDWSRRFHVVRSGESLSAIIADKTAAYKSSGFNDAQINIKLQNYIIDQSNIDDPALIEEKQLIFFPTITELKSVTVETIPEAKPQITQVKPDTTDKKQETTAKTAETKTAQAAKEVTNTEKVTSTKTDRSNRPKTFTRGVTTNHPYWQVMLSTIKGKGLRIDDKNLANTFDLAHLIIKEVELTNSNINNPDKLLLEMKLVALSVRNRAMVTSAKKGYRVMWGNPTWRDVMLHPFQFSSFNFSQSKKISTMKKFYTDTKWALAVEAAGRIISGDQSGIDKKYLNIVSYYNPDISNPKWPNEKYKLKSGPISRFQEVDTPFTHKFYQENPKMPGAKVLNS